MDDTESRNRAIHEGVLICPYDANWITLFECEHDRLLNLFPSDIVAIEHFGSTAVPGLSAKPIIDLMAGVDSMQQADALLSPLCEAKYTTSIQFNASLVGRRWLMRYANGRRTHHLHLMVYGSQQWHRHLAFRDILRSDRDFAKCYEQNKYLWATKYRLDREAYTAAKAEFICEALM